MKEKTKVLLFLASNSPFYTNLYPSIKKGFEEAGCEVKGASNLLDSTKLIREIEDYKPDFVFEMNRVKSEIKNFPQNIIHICWLVDFWGRLHDELKGSDILYVWAENWIEEFETNNIKPVYHLPPATDEDIYKLHNTSKQYDFIFLGHISQKWTDEELLREVGICKNNKIFFKDLLPYIKKFVLTKYNKKSFLDSLEDGGIKLYKPIDKTLLYDISNRAFRQIKRELYLDKFIDTKKKIAIYGSENWQSYDKYKRYYKGYISKPSEINETISQSNILLHDGNYPHFRTFDAMATGVVVAAAQPPDNYNDPWGKLGFKSVEDYINVDIYEHGDRLQVYEDEESLKQIAKNARRKVLQRHLWVHRAQQILQDVSNFLKDRNDK